MRQKKLVIGLLVMLALVVSSFTYAYWNSIDLEDSVTGTSVTIGEGKTVTVTASLTSSGSGQLVPSGFAASSISASPVESLQYTFTINWADNSADGATGTIAISATSTEPLLNFAYSPISGSAITEGTPLVVTVTVTLTEPLDQAAYDALQLASVTFDVTFTVTED